MGHLFKHRAFKKGSASCNVKRKRISKKLTSAILRSTLTANIDHVVQIIMIRIPIVVVVFVIVIVIVAIIVFALVIEAYLFVWFDVPSGKYGEKRFLNIAFVNVAGIQSTVWVTGMILRVFHISR